MNETVGQKFRIIAVKLVQHYYPSKTSKLFSCDLQYACRLILQYIEISFVFHSYLHIHVILIHAWNQRLVDQSTCNEEIFYLTTSKAKAFPIPSDAPVTTTKDTKQ